MNRTSAIRVLIADDHLVVRMGLASIISRTPGLSLAGEAESGEEAVRLARELAPDVVVMDLKMAPTDGAAATARILADRPETKVLILTSFADATELRPALAAGATGALLKTSHKDEILAAIRSVREGTRTISPELERLLDEDTGVASLSPRQIEILRLVAKGYSNRDIADILDIGAESVKQHLKNAFARLGVSSRAEATARLLAHPENR